MESTTMKPTVLVYDRSVLASNRQSDIIYADLAAQKLTQFGYTYDQAIELFTRASGETLEEKFRQIVIPKLKKNSAKEEKAGMESQSEISPEKRIRKAVGEIKTVLEEDNRFAIGFWGRNGLSTTLIPMPQIYIVNHLLHQKINRKLPVSQIVISSSIEKDELENWFKIHGMKTAIEQVMGKYDGDSIISQLDKISKLKPGHRIIFVSAAWPKIKETMNSYLDIEPILVSTNCTSSNLEKITGRVETISQLSEITSKIHPSC